jgi:hypothetical protein
LQDTVVCFLIVKGVFLFLVLLGVGN